MADYLTKRGANVAPSYASTDNLPASTQAGDLVFVGGQLGIAVNASTFNTCDKTDILALFGGTIKGFMWGGQGRGDKVESISFTSDGNAASLSDANVERLYNNSDMYVGGGILFLHGSPDTTASNFELPYRKYTVSSSAEAASSADPTVKRSSPGVGRDVASTKQFFYGGTGMGAGDGAKNSIDKLTYSSEGYSALSTTLQQSMGLYGSGTSTTKDYLAGGHDYINMIQAFTHSSEANTADTADLIEVISKISAVSSATHSYFAGGFGTAGGYGRRNNVQKFTFSSEGNTTDHADLILASMSMAGLSSTTVGYYAGGYESANSNRIQKITFASDTFTADIGDLNTAGGNAAMSRGAH